MTSSSEEALPHRERWEAQQHVDHEFWFKADGSGAVVRGHADRVRSALLEARPGGLTTGQLCTADRAVGQSGTRRLD